MIVGGKYYNANKYKVNNGYIKKIVGQEIYLKTFETLDSKYIHCQVNIW